MMICSNGHETAEGSRFCEECGLITVPGDTELCPHGHINPPHRKFCGDCGAPIAPPTPPESGGPTGRWMVDPTYRHHFRYVDEGAWTEHVADIGNGTFGVDPPPRAGRSKGRTLTDILTGGVLLVLIVGAISAATIFFSQSNEAATDLRQAEVIAGPTAVPPAEFLPTPTTLRPFAVIGAPCVPNSVNGVQRNGAPAYCELLEGTDLYMWSMYWGVIRSPFNENTDPSERETPGVAVCMMQLNLPRQACIAQMPR